MATRCFCLRNLAGLSIDIRQRTDLFQIALCGLFRCVAILMHNLAKATMQLSSTVLLLKRLKL
jgi:hypothetical protein